MGGGVDGGIGHIACPISIHAWPKHAHRYEQIDIVEIGKGVAIGADADAVVWVEPRADNGGLFIDRVDAWTTDMEANVHGVIPFSMVSSIIRVDVHSVV